VVEIEEVILEFIQSQPDMTLGSSPNSYNQSLIASGLIDSLAVVQILEFLEARFDVRFDPEDLTGENFDSISAMAALVRARLSSDR